MIFVVLGTQKFQFNRLLQTMDKAIEEGKITEPVFAQIGYSDYVPKHFEFTKFLDSTEFKKKISECDILLAHGGVGTIISGVERNKPVVVWARRKEFGEHVDDHQMQIAGAFAKKNYVLMCEQDNMAEMLNSARTHKFEHYVSQKQNVVDTIAAYIGL